MTPDDDPRRPGETVTEHKIRTLEAHAVRVHEAVKGLIELVREQEVRLLLLEARSKAFDKPPPSNERQETS